MIMEDVKFAMKLILIINMYIITENVKFVT